MKHPEHLAALGGSLPRPIPQQSALGQTVPVWRGTDTTRIPSLTRASHGSARSFAFGRVLTLALALMAGTTFAATIYVAPTGNDAWSGQRAAPAAGGQDGPLATLGAALAKARALRAADAAADLRIVLRGGTYELAAPLELKPEDSGASAARPLVVEAESGERPVLSGGRRITGWQRTPGERPVWTVTLPEARAGTWRFNSLFVDGRRATRARTPNEGYFRMRGARVSDDPVRFHFKPGDLKPEWAADPHAEVVAFEKWTDFRQHIRALDTTSNLVTLSFRAAPHTREGEARYFIENTADSLDAPGEWYLDRRSGVLSYFARPGEDPNRLEVSAPRLTVLLRTAPDFERARAVRHVRLRGLTFACTDWPLPEQGLVDVQAAVEQRGVAQLDGAVEWTLEDCAFERLGCYGLDLGRGAQRVTVARCRFTDLGAGGVRIGEPQVRKEAFDANHSHTLTDNTLRGLGRVHAPAVGVFILQSGTNRVAHNEISDLFYTAISVGWHWGYDVTPCRENVIEFNHLHHVGQGRLSDMGGIYTLGIQRGTVLRNNLIHDVESDGYGGWGLYTDEGSSDIVLESNVVYRCKSAGFHQHYGRENVVRNNVFALNREHQLMRSREEEHVSFFFTNNLVYFNSGTLLGSTWRNNRFVLDRNVYFDARPGAEELKFAGATLAQWRARGHDAHSVIADPGFVAPDKFDFRLKQDSPAFKLGFKPIDLTTVGPRK